MKTSNFLLVLGSVCVISAVSAFAGDQENIQGNWKLEAMTLDGKAMKPVAVVYTFKGDTLTVRPEAGREDKATFQLEIAAKPKVMVVQHAQQLPDAKSDRTPYELEGDTLKIALTSPDEHPADVSDKGHILFTLKRTKP